VNRLYQWLSNRATFFRSDVSARGTTRTVRTETTVRQQGVTLLVGSAGILGLDTCPLCGNQLAPAEAERAKHRLLEAAIAQETGPVESQPP